METYYVFTCNGRIFYTSISLNDRFKQYKVFCPVWYRLDYNSYFENRSPKRRRYETDPSWNRFAMAPIIWDPNLRGRSDTWFFGESPWVSSDKHEPEIYKPEIYKPEVYKQEMYKSEIYKPEIPQPVANKRKRQRRRKKTKNASTTKKTPTMWNTKQTLTKEQLDEELDRYMMEVK